MVMVSKHSKKVRKEGVASLIIMLVGMASKVKDWIMCGIVSCVNRYNLFPGQ